MNLRRLTLAVVAASALLLAACGGSASKGLKRTGETNAMGMPVIETPGTPAGSQTRGGATLEPASWALGRVPLNVAVRPSWMIRNTGAQAFTLGTARTEIRKGCCPGPITVNGPTTVNPGGETRVTFELSMHPGMDGAHDMDVVVPLTYADGTTDTVTATVTGDFRA